MDKRILLIIIFLVTGISFSQTTVTLQDQCNCEVLSGTLVATPGATTPGGADIGDIYVNTTTGTIYFWDGDSWELTSSDNQQLQSFSFDATTNLLSLTLENGGSVSVDLGSLRFVETLTTIVENANGTFTYTDEAGNPTIIDITNLETLTTIALNVDNTHLDYTDEDGTTIQVDLTAAVKNLETLTTIVENVNGTFTYTDEAGNPTIIDVTNLETLTTIALNADNTNLDYTDEDGTTIQVDLTAAVKNLETLTTIVENVNGTFTYTDEAGNPTIIDITNLETLTTIALNADNTHLDYTDEDGTTIQVDLTAAVKNLETLTTIVENANGTFTYTDEAGNPTIIDVTNLETLTTIALNADNTNLDYTDEDGTTIQVDLTAAVKNLETLTTIVENVNGTFTYTDEAGNPTIIDITNLETLTTIALNADNTHLDYTDEDGTTIQVDLTAAVKNLETLTTIVENANGTFTYTDEAGNPTIIDVTNLETLTTIALNADNTNLDYTDEDGTTIQVDLTAAVKNLETLTTIVENANGTFTYTDEAGNPTIIDITNLETLTTIALNADNTHLDYTDEDGTTIQVDLTAAVKNLETLTTIVETANGTFTYTDEAGNPTIIDVTNLETLTTIALNADNTHLDYTDEDGTTIQVDLTAAVKNLETLTTIVENANGTFTYTDEAGNPTIIDVTNLETLTTIALNADNTHLDYTDEDGTTIQVDLTAAVKNLETLTTIVENVNGTFTYTDEAGNPTIIDITNLETLTTIALNADNTNLDYTDEDGTTIQVDLTAAVKNLETLTTIVENANGTFTYTDEAGNLTIIDITNLETLTTIALNADNTNLDYTDEDGTTIQVDLTAAVKNLETLTTIVENANGTLTYTDEAGNPTIIDITNLETLTTIALNADNTNLDYTDEDGTTIQVDLTAAVKNLETLTTIVENANGTFTYTDEAGNPTIIDITNLETLTTIALNADNTHLDYTDEDGTTIQVDLTAAVKNLETLTTLVKNNDGTLTFTNESGAPNSINLISTNANNDIVAGSDGGLYLNVASVAMSETITTLTDHGDGTFTYENESGVTTTFDAKRSTVLDNGDGTFSITDDSGNSVTITGNTNTTNTTLTENGTDLILTDSEGNFVSIPLANIAPIADQVTITGVGTTADPFKVEDLSIVTAKLANDAVTNAKMADNAVQTENIVNGTILTEDMASGGNDKVMVTDALGTVEWIDKSSFAAIADQVTITGVGTTADPFKVEDLSIVTAKLANDAVTNAKLADNAVQTENIVNGTILTEDMASGGNDKVMVTDALGTVEWIDKSSFAAIADQVTITGVGTTADPFKVEDLSIVTAKLANDAVTNAKLADNAVQTENIVNGTILTEDMASGGNDKVMVTDALGTVEWIDKSSFAAIADQVTITGVGTTADPFKVEDLSIVTAKLANDAVTNVKLADNAVQTENIVNGTILTEDMASGGNDKVMVTDALGMVEWIDKSSFAAIADQVTITGVGTTADPFKVEDLSIVTAKLANDAVTNAKLADNAVQTENILSGGNDKVLVTDALGTVEWIDKSSFAAIADQVTITGVGTTADPFKVEDLSIITAKLANDAVTSAKIVDKAITLSKLQDGTLDGQVMQWDNGTSSWTLVDLGSVTVTENDGVIGNEVVGATDATLIRSGSGTTVSPYTLDVSADGITNAELADNAVQTENILSGGNDKVLVTDALGTVEWIDKSSFAAIADQVTITGLGTTADPFKVEDLSIVTAKLANDAVTNAKLADNAVQTENILNGTILTEDMASGGNDKVMVTDALGTVEWIDKSSFAAIADQVTITGLGTTADPFKVEDLSIVTAKLANDAVTNAKLADNAVQTENIVNGTILTEDMASGGNDKVMVTDALGMVEWIDKSSFAAIADQVTITGLGTTADPFKVEDLSIVTAKLANDAVTNAKLADNAVQTENIVNGTILTEDMASGGNDKVMVTDALGMVEWIDKSSFAAIADQVTITGVGTTADPFKVEDLSIVTTKIADNAVTSVKIADNAVTPLKVDASIAGTGLTRSVTGVLSVDGTAITGDGNITSNDLTVGGDLNALLGDVTLEIATGAVGTTELADGAVTSAKIVDKAITLSKLQDGTSDGQVMQWDNGTSSWTLVDLGSVTVTENDGVIGNEVVNATDGTLVRSGSGTTVSPYTLDVSADGITNAELADNAVQTENILNGTILTEDMASGGNDKVMVTNASGTVEWIDKTFLNTDNQQINLAANTLTLSNGTGADTTVDLSGYVSSDNQNLTSATIDASNILTIAIEDGAPVTVNLSSFLDNTDNQQITAFSLDNTTKELTLTLENGGTQIVDFTTVLAAAGTDNQNISSSVVTANESVNIALERGGNTTINIQDADSDPTNEIQNVASVDASVTVTRTVNDFDLSVNFPANNDNSSTNELQDLSLSSDILTLTTPATVGNQVDLSSYMDNTDEQDLTSATLTGTSLEIAIENGAPVTVNLASLVDDADNDPTNEIQDLNFTGDILTITNNGSATDIDLSGYTNTDTQDLSIDLTGKIISLVDGGSVTINADDADADPTNELITSANLTGTDLNIIDAGGTTTVDLSSLNNSGTDDQVISTTGAAGNISIENGNTLNLNVNDADADPTNELITSANLTGTDLNIIDAGGTTTVDLSSLNNSGTDDQALSLAGTILTLEDGGTVDLISFMDNTDTQDLSIDATGKIISLVDGGSVTINADDADSDPTNEIQDLNLTGDILTITNNGSATDIDLSGYTNTDNQTLNIAGDQLSITGGNTVTVPTADGTETKVTAGNDISVTGDGSSANPYVVNNVRPNIFYPPSIAVDASSTGTGRTINLYNQYTAQFGSPMVASTSAPAAIPTYANTDLYYYVTYYDNTVFANVSVDEFGVMTYDVIASPTDYNSLINVVFVVK
ncbi:hypothetical protein HCG49_14365 [Arenibacter sp. 6A1]|uniref:beta strand repeat-containing protein n=1 Tax=Arenibacter sp. 6A1 TaxID=2720391 RepID=UPI001445C294|nr:hypothetical protein [Arenibacter sp. 6A1]NKI27750.1 hypothetical protein [Arenibacter sp. 6A1]